MRNSAFLLALACARTVPYTRTPLPCQAEAVHLVWSVIYGRSEPPPDVWWVPPADQTCGRTVNGARGFPAPVMVDGKMKNGCAGSSAAADSVNLVWFGEWELTGLAHEMAHVAQAHDGLPPDNEHKSAAFAPGGMVERANASLSRLECAP